MKKQILLLETISEPSYQLLKDKFTVHLAQSPYSGGDIADKHSIHGIITRGKGAVNDQLIFECGPLEVIARCGVGLDNIDVAFASNQEIPVINAPNSNANTVAEHTLALILMLQRQLFASVVSVKTQQWKFRNKYQGDEIRGKTLGILGLGNIGQKVAQLAQLFGMKVQYWDQVEKEVPYKKVDFNTIFRTSDIITIHVPLVNETHHLVGRRELTMMQPHALLINTARGKIIDQQALKGVLLEERIGGFASDVLEEEPPSSEENWLLLPNVIVTPHSASLTKSTFHEMCMTTVKNVIQLLNGETIDPKYIFNRNELSISM